jgi:hypothetical protein
MNIPRIDLKRHLMPNQLVTLSSRASPLNAEKLQQESIGITEVRRVPYTKRESPFQSTYPNSDALSLRQSSGYGSKDHSDLNDN